MHHELGDWLTTLSPGVSSKWCWLQTYMIDWQPKAANVSRWHRRCVHHTMYACTTPFVQHFTFRLLMDIYFLTIHGRSLSVSDRYWTADSEAADFTGSVRSNFGWIVRPLETSDLYRPLRGDVIEVFEIMHTIYHTIVSPDLSWNFFLSHNHYNAMCD